MKTLTQTPFHRIANGLLIIALLTFALIFWRVGDSLPFGTHNWREADTANFILNYAQDPSPTNPFATRLHQRGQGNGITGSELPLIYFLESKLIDLNGHYYLMIRAINLLFLAGIFFCFQGIVLIYSNERLTARLAACLLVFNPLVLYYTFKIMPEIHYIGFGMLSAFLLLTAMKRSNPLFFGLSAISLSLGTMIKPFAMAFVAPAAFEMVFYFLREHFTWESKPNRRPVGFWIAFVVSIAIPIIGMFAWFSYARKLSQANQNYMWLHYDFWEQLRFLTKPDFFRRLIIVTYTEMVSSWGGMLMLIGIPVWMAFRRARYELPQLFWAGLAWLFAALLIILVIGAYPFYTGHEYYLMILVPPTLLLMTALLRQLPLLTKRSEVCAVILIFVTVFGGFLRVFRRFNPASITYETQRQASRIIPMQQRVIIADWTPVVNLNVINRFGLTVSSSEDKKQLIKYLEAGYWYVCLPEQKAGCIKLRDDFKNRVELLTEKPLLTVARLKH